MHTTAPFALSRALVLTGCNTAEGFGQDVENTGEAMQEGARDAKKELK